MKAKGTIKSFKMNRLEEAFGETLLAEQRGGRVAWFKYEGITLKLADDTRYTPDFFVMHSDGTLIVYEVKGPFKREDSWVKLKVASAQFPFIFVLVTRDPDGRWCTRHLT